MPSCVLVIPGKLAKTLRPCSCCGILVCRFFWTPKLDQRKGGSSGSASNLLKNKPLNIIDMRCISLLMRDLNQSDLDSTKRGFAPTRRGSGIPFIFSKDNEPRLSTLETMKSNCQGAQQASPCAWFSRGARNSRERPCSSSRSIPSSQVEHCIHCALALTQPLPWGSATNLS